MQVPRLWRMTPILRGSKFAIPLYVPNDEEVHHHTGSPEREGGGGGSERHILTPAEELTLSTAIIQAHVTSIE